MSIGSTVSVIIPVFNNWKLTRQCLSSLAENSPPGLEVVVVDNGSTDETAEYLESFGQALFSGHFRRIRFEENRNFAPACNAGARSARTDFLFFLNNDTLILPEWLPPLLAEFSLSPRLGATGPLLMYPDRTVQHLGIAFWPEGLVGHLYQNLPISHKLASRKRFFKALTGAALLVPRSLFLRVGGFDEGYINGFEDVDFGLRLTQHGYRLCNVPESRIVHLESRTPQRHAYGSANSRRLYTAWNLSECTDLPDIVAEDGYSLRVMPELHLKVALSPEGSGEYIRRLRPFDAAACFSFLEEEPLWLEGYTLLGEYLERNGEWEMPLQLYQNAAKYSMHCSFEDYARLKRVMAALGRDVSPLAAVVEPSLRQICDERKYEEKRLMIMRQLSKGTPAGRALLPLYREAGKEARKLRCCEQAENSLFEAKRISS